MTEFSRLDDVRQGLLCLFALAAVLLLIYDLIRCAQLGRKRMLAAAAALLAAALCLVQIMAMNAYKYPHYPAGIRLRTAPVILMILLLLFTGALQLWLLRRWSGSHISPMSVKEAFDSLPAGLCYYLPGGILRLVNTAMNRLANAVTGLPLLDPEGFWRELRGGALPVSLRGGEAPMIRLPDGSVFRFSHRVFLTELGQTHELVATEVTRDYNLNLALEQNRRRAAELNVRLKALLDGIEYLTMSRELMQLKAEIHDELGKSLLLSERYLRCPGSVKASEVREAWRKNLRLLESSGREPWQTPYYPLRKQAAALGIRLEIQGELPAEPRLIPVVETVLSVHMTNVLRHAGGARARVVSEKDGQGWRLTFTNDGKPPRRQVREGGGLTNLRNQAEALGGSMEIESAPAFRLCLYLPTEE